MAGYLSGIVWGGLFTAAGLAVVSEMTLPSGLGAKAANSAEAPVAEQPAEPAVAQEAPAETPVAEATAPEPVTEETPPAETPVEPVAAEPDTESAVQTENTTDTAEATPEVDPMPEVDLPPIVTVTADEAAAQIKANTPVVAAAPEASSEAPAAVAEAEPAEPVVAPEADTGVAAQTAPDAPAEPEVAEASPAAPEQPAETTPETAATETAPAQTETTATASAEPADEPATVDANAAAAALVETNPAATEVTGDEAELAGMDSDTPRAGVVLPGQVPGRTFGDGDDAEGMMPVDEAALESAVSDNAPAEPAPEAEVATATPAAETEAPVAPEAEQTEVAAAPDVATLTEVPAETAEDAPALLSPEGAADAPQIDTAPAAEETQMASAEEAAKGQLPRKIQTEGQRAAEQAAAEAAATEEPAETAGSLEPARLRNSADGVVTNRLPRIGDDAEVKVEAADADPAADTRPPVEKFATEFENTEKQPVLAVVLVDNGASQSLRDQVADLPFPVAVALDPLAPDAVDAAAFYRGAGVEIVMLATGIPRGAEASDVEVTFATHAEVLPEAVAVMDTEEGGFQNNRPLATLVAPTVAAQGLGLITWDEGLNAGDQVARREGMSAGLIFRRFDEAGNNDTGMRRTLDRAALKAGQDGATIVAGVVNAQSLQSLVAWTLGAKGQAVAMAPVSSAMEKPENAADGKPVATE
jgi:uncharacterized protein